VLEFSPVAVLSHDPCSHYCDVIKGQRPVPLSFQQEEEKLLKEADFHATCGDDEKGAGTLKDRLSA
jgi:hypothetical protein